MDSAEEVTSFVAEAGLLCCASVQGGTIIAGDEEGWLYVLQFGEHTNPGEAFITGDVISL